MVLTLTCFALLSHGIPSLTYISKREISSSSQVTKLGLAYKLYISRYILAVPCGMSVPRAQIRSSAAPVSHLRRGAEQSTECRVTWHNSSNHRLVPLKHFPSQIHPQRASTYNSSPNHSLPIRHIQALTRYQVSALSINLTATLREGTLSNCSFC